MPEATAARVLRIAGITLALGLACSSLPPFPASAAPARAPATYTFRFAPPAGRGPVETMRRTSVQESGGRRSTRVMTVKSRTTTRATANGYRSTMTPISATATENGKSIKEKFVTDLLKIPYTVDVSKNGRLLRVSGYEAAMARVRNSLPPQVAQALGAVFSKEAFEQRARDEWDRRIGGFVGETIKIGDAVEGTFEAPVDGGNPVVWNTRIRYAGTVVKAGRTYVRVKFHYVVDPNSATEWADQFISQMMQAMPNAPADFNISDVQITETGERLIHPATMTIASETSTKRTQMRMTMEGQTQTIAKSETSQYSLALPAVKAAPKRTRKTGR